MTNKVIDVVGMGNAIVDVIAQVDERFLDENGVAKGAMTLVDQARAQQLYEKFSAPKQISGGSVANTIASLASLGLSCAFMGKVARDELGESFKSGLETFGVEFFSNPLTNGPSTAMSLIAVTPDAERSMSTFLGASTAFEESDVSEPLIAKSEILYLEGYLFDSDQAKTAFHRAAQFAEKHGTKVALSLSDSFCVTRHKESFLAFIKDNVDILFANEQEALEITGEQDVDTAIVALQEISETGAVTLSKKGAQCWISRDRAFVPADRDVQVKDTTGAGDAFATGFLYGLIKKKIVADSGRLGVACAQEIIKDFGARPETDLKFICKRMGLL